MKQKEEKSRAANGKERYVEILLNSGKCMVD